MRNYFRLSLLFVALIALTVIVYAQQTLPSRGGAAQIINGSGTLTFAVDTSGNATITPSGSTVTIPGATVTTGATIGATNINATAGFSVGGGATIKAIYSAVATLDFPSIIASSTTNLTITVTGAGTNSVVFLGLPAAFVGGLGATGFVSSTNTVSVVLTNPTIAAIDPAAGSFRATVIQY